MHNNVHESPPINRPFWTLIRLQTHNVRNCVDWRAGGLEAGGLADWRQPTSQPADCRYDDIENKNKGKRERGNHRGTPGNSRELQGTKGAKGTKGAMVSASDHRVRLTVRG